MSKEKSSLTLANSFDLTADENRNNLCAAFMENSEERPYAFASYSHMNEGERAEFLESINTTKVKEYDKNYLCISEGFADSTVNSSTPDYINEKVFSEDIIEKWFMDQTGANGKSASLFSNAVKQTRSDIATCLSVDFSEVQVNIVKQGDHNDERFVHKDLMDEGYRVSQSFLGEKTQFAVGQNLHPGLDKFGSYNEKDIEGYVEAGPGEVAAFRTAYKGAVHVEPETKGNGRLMVLYMTSHSYKVEPRIMEDLVQKSTQNFTKFVESQESYQEEVKSAEDLKENNFNLKSSLTLANSFDLTADENRNNLCAAFMENSEERPYAFASYSHMNEDERVDFLESINTTKVKEYEGSSLRISEGFPDSTINSSPPNHMVKKVFSKEIIEKWFMDRTDGNSNSASLFSNAVKQTRSDIAYCLNVDFSEVMVKIFQEEDHDYGIAGGHKDWGSVGYRVSQSFLGEKTQFAVGENLHPGGNHGSFDQKDIEGYVEAGPGGVAVFRTADQGAVHSAPDTKGNGRLLVLYTTEHSYKVEPRIMEDLVQKSTQNFTKFVESQESYQEEVKSAEDLKEASKWEKDLKEVSDMPINYQNLDAFKSLDEGNDHKLPGTDGNLSKLSGAEITHSPSSISNGDLVAAAAVVAAALHASGAISMLRKASRAISDYSSGNAPKQKQDSKGSSRGR